MTPSEAPDPPELDPDRAPLLRSTVVAMGASTVLLVIGMLLAVAWVWQLFRTQQRLGGGGLPGIGGGFDEGPGPSMLERVDVAAQSTFALAYAGIVVGLGVGLRLLADMMVARLGHLGSIAPEPTIGPDVP
jgi:hypothetical protein